MQGVTAISRKISGSWAPRLQNSRNRWAKKWGPTCDRHISNSAIYTTAIYRAYTVIPPQNLTVKIEFKEYSNLKCFQGVTSIASAALGVLKFFLYFFLVFCIHLIIVMGVIFYLIIFQWKSLWMVIISMHSGEPKWFKESNHLNIVLGEQKFFRYPGFSHGYQRLSYNNCTKSCWPFWLIDMDLTKAFYRNNSDLHFCVVTPRFIGLRWNKK